MFCQEEVGALHKQFRDIELALENDDLRVNHQLKEILAYGIQ